MNNNVRKVFDILVVEPYEKFKIGILWVETDDEPGDYALLNGVYYIDESLMVHIEGSDAPVPRALRALLAREAAIIKLSKEPDKKNRG